MLISYGNNLLLYRTHEQIQKPIVTTIKLNKQIPKKRGRKSKIEKMQAAYRYNIKI